jgi:hypothetical protein
LFRKNLAVLFLGFSPLLLLGCLSNSYEIKRDELERLAAVEPENRWQSVRAVQRIGGDDYPPEDDSAIGTGPTGHVYVSTVVIDSHHHYYHYPPRRSVTRPGAEASAGGTRTVGGLPTSGGSGSNARSASKGKGDPASAAVIAAAVVAGAGAGFALAGSEGARYDGWVAVNPDEPVYLRLQDGLTRPVALSRLSAADLAAVDGATIYEGDADRFPKLGRAPLDRAGFTLMTALHMGGMPQIEGTTATGFGGYLLLGGNIANIATLGLGATVDSGLNSRHSLLTATVAPELQLFPIRYVGVYGAAGWSFRNTGLDYGTRADEGWLTRGGVLGELPFTTRLALQARAGVSRQVFDQKPTVTWEGQLGLAIY